MELTDTAQRVVATASDVTREIRTIATSIISNYPTSPLFVSLLRGAAPFTSKLMFEITRQSPDYHPEVDYMMVSTYGTGHHAGEPKIVTDLAPSTVVDGRTVVIIDDVLDKGITAKFVQDYLLSRGAADVELAVLCTKTVNRVTDVQPNYSGFTFGDAWLVGMGMDDSRSRTDGFRWLEEIREVHD